MACHHARRAHRLKFIQHIAAYLARLGMAAQRLLRENQFAVDGHFKLTAAGGDEFPRADKRLNFSFTQDFVRQTDDARAVVSDRAVFNRDIQQGILHDALLTVLLYTKYDSAPSSQPLKEDRLSYIQDILSEYTRMRDNGLETKAALQALRPHIESLDQTQRAELAALIRTWESRPSASAPPPAAPVETGDSEPRKHAVIRPIARPAEPEPAPPSGVPTQPMPDINWVKCPHCGKPNQQHEVFCYACGQLLEPIKGGGATKHFADTSSDVSSEYFGPDSVLALRVRGSSEVFEVRPQTADHEIVIGRSSSGSAITPDIDLTSKQAADLGVSRMHVALRYEPDQNAILVSDLGSANGTYIGGQRLLPKEIRVLRHGDELRLGKLMMIISFRHPGKPAG